MAVSGGKEKIVAILAPCLFTEHTFSLGETKYSRKSIQMPVHVLHKDDEEKRSFLLKFLNFNCFNVASNKLNLLYIYAG